MRNVVTLLLLFLAQNTCADDWYWTGSAQTLFKSYNISTELDSLCGIAASFSADYLERSGFSLGYSLNHTEYKPHFDTGIVEIDERTLYLGAHSNHHPNSLPGVLTLQLGAYLGKDSIRSKSVTTTNTSPGPGPGGQTSSTRRFISTDDNYEVVNPVISYSNYRKTFYADLGYAFSHYASDDNNTDDLDVQQWTPTLGFAFNRGYDWLQLRVYWISLSNSNRVAGKKSTSALETKWIHWYNQNKPSYLHSTQISVLIGERRYAVDSDSTSLFNIPELQTAAFSIGGTWVLAEQTNLLALGGYERYENPSVDDKFNAIYMFAYLSHQW